MQVKRIFQIYFLPGSLYSILLLTETKQIMLLATLQCKEKGSVALKCLTTFCNILMSFSILLSRGQLSLHF